MDLPFDVCCEHLRDALFLDEPRVASNFCVGENCVFMLSVGITQTEDGPAFFDAAVLFCPFCGKQLQTKEEVFRKANVVSP